MRKLTKLRIDEVSAVLRGAGEGCEVVLAKSHDGTAHRETIREMFESVDYSKLGIVAPPPDDDDDLEDATDDTDSDVATTVPDKLQGMVAALIAAVPTLTPQMATYFLLHNPHGQAMARHLANITKKGITTMNRAEELRDIAKQYGVARIAKMIVMEGTSHGISEAEFTKMIDDAAQQTRLPGERPGTAFSRYFSAAENVELRRAHALTKTSVPVPVEIVPVGQSDVSDDDSSAAYQKLQKMATELQRSSPGLSEAQAFSKVFQDPANASTAEKAHRRPTATTSYAWPR